MAVRGGAEFACESPSRRRHSRKSPPGASDQASRGTDPMGFSRGMARRAKRQAGGPTMWAALLVAVVVMALPGLAHAQGAVRSVHGDWQIRCDTPPGAQTEQCALIQ